MATCHALAALVSLHVLETWSLRCSAQQRIGNLSQATSTPSKLQDVHQFDRSALYHLHKLFHPFVECDPSRAQNRSSQQLIGRGISPQQHTIKRSKTQASQWPFGMRPSESIGPTSAQSYAVAKGQEQEPGPSAGERW